MATTRETEVKVVLVDMICDKCNKGVMETNGSPKYNNILDLNEKPKIPHKCNICGHETDYDTSYPYQKLIPIEDRMREE